MVGKKNLTNPHVVDLLKLLESVNRSVNQVNKKIGECTHLYSYIENGTVVKENEKPPAVFAAQNHRKKQIKYTDSPIVSRSTFVEFENLASRQNFPT